MKQKKATPATDLAVAAAENSIVINLDNIKTLVRHHAIFFDTLVEAIPPRFYLPSNDDKPWYQGLSKSAKASAKRKTIENIRIARRNRLDPEKSSKTTIDFLKESIESKKSENELIFDAGSDGDDDEGGGDEEEEEEGKEGQGKSRTYEELQMKMRKRLEELKAGRTTGEGGERRREKREEWKRKRNEYEGGKGQGQGKGKGKGKGKVEDEVEKKRREKAAVEKEVAAAENEIEFGKVKLAASVDDAVFNKNKIKKRKLSKEQELKRAVELEEAKNNPEKGNIVKAKHAWKAATDRAMGIKVHDDPSRLKKSIENETRKQKKSKEAWKQRVETTVKSKKAKQEKRTTNIEKLKTKKKEAKIAKRAKKSMRAGFEGRKKGFVTKGE